MAAGGKEQMFIRN